MATPEKTTPFPEILKGSVLLLAVLQHQQGFWFQGIKKKRKEKTRRKRKRRAFGLRKRQELELEQIHPFPQRLTPFDLRCRVPFYCIRFCLKLPGWAACKILSKCTCELKSGNMQRNVQMIEKLFIVLSGRGGGNLFDQTRQCFLQFPPSFPNSRRVCYFPKPMKGLLTL